MLWGRYDDLYSVTLEALWLSAERFEPERGVPFISYASRRMAGAIIDYVRREDHLTRDERKRVTAGAPEPWSVRHLEDIEGWSELLRDDSAKSPEDVLLARDKAQRLEVALKQLPARLAVPVRMKLAGDTLKVIGRRFGYTESNALCTVREGVKQLRALLRRRQDGVLGAARTNR